MIDDYVERGSMSVQQEITKPVIHWRVAFLSAGVLAGGSSLLEIFVLSKLMLLCAVFCLGLGLVEALNVPKKTVVVSLGSFVGLMALTIWAGMKSKGF